MLFGHVSKFKSIITTLDYVRINYKYINELEHVFKLLENDSYSTVIADIEMIKEYLIFFISYVKSSFPKVKIIIKINPTDELIETRNLEKIVLFDENISDIRNYLNYQTKILYISHERTIQDDIFKQFSTSGFIMEIKENVVSALTAIKDIRPEMIFFDLSISKGEVKRFISILKSDYFNIIPPTMVMIGKDNNNYSVLLMELNGEQFVEKLLSIDKKTNIKNQLYEKLGNSSQNIPVEKIEYNKKERIIKTVEEKSSNKKSKPLDNGYEIGTSNQTLFIIVNKAFSVQEESIFKNEIKEYFNRFHLDKRFIINLIDAPERKDYSVFLEIIFSFKTLFKNLSDKNIKVIIPQSNKALYESIVSNEKFNQCIIETK